MNPTPNQEAPAKPRVSVVIVAHDCEQTLRRCLTAVNASDERPGYEVLVVDAGSTDGCPRIDAEFSGVTMLRLPMNFGKARARNIGMRTAQAELLLFLDPHIEVRRDTISTLAAALEARADATAVAPVLETPAGQSLESAARLPSPEQLSQASLQLEPLPRVEPAGEAVEVVDEYALLVRRTFIAGMNYLDEKRFSEHWSLLDVYFQIRNAGKRLLLIADARATLHPLTPVDEDETTLIADAVSGASAYVAKHFGFGAGLSFRLKCALRALGGFRIGLLVAILSGRRLDPTS